MKLSYKKILVILLIAAFIIPAIWFMCTILSESQDLCYEPGSGLTTLNVRVLDKNTRQPIDSVRLSIRYGISSDYWIDTLLRQNNGITYSFNIPEGDCDNYWAEFSSKDYYWNDLDFADSTSGHITKGKVNTITALLTPATTIRLTLHRDRANTATDTAFLDITDIKPVSEYEDNGTGDRYTRSTFIKPGSPREQPVYWRTFITHLTVRSGTTYDIRWVRKDSVTLDTLTSRFKALPFDTVAIQYTFPDNQQPARRRRLR